MKKTPTKLNWTKMETIEKRAIVELIKKKMLKIWKLQHKKKKIEISTLKIVARGQLTEHNIQ